jgi:hypothetical protein
MPLPHLLHVPSAQSGPLDFSAPALLLDDSSSSLSRLAVLSLSLAPSLELEELWASSAADLGLSLVAVPPPQ